MEAILPLPAINLEVEDGKANDELRFALTVGRITMVLLASEQYRYNKISDLGWLVLPPVALGQSAVSHAVVDGYPTSVAAAVWAYVTPEVDRRLAATLDGPLALAPEEWASGDIPWLIEALGTPDALWKLLNTLHSNVFQQCSVKCRVLEHGIARFSMLAELIAKSDAKPC